MDTASGLENSQGLCFNLSDPKNADGDGGGDKGTGGHRAIVLFAFASSMNDLSPFPHYVPSLLLLTQWHLLPPSGDSSG